MASDPCEFEDAVLEHCVRIIQYVRFPNGEARPLQLLLKSMRSKPYRDVMEDTQDMSINDDACSSSSESTLDSSGSLSSNELEEDNESDNIEQMPFINRAYSIGEEISLANYGRVLMGSIVERDSPRGEWRVTGERLAIKEMPWQRIRARARGRTEDPRIECAAMQHIRRCFNTDVIDGGDVSVQEAMNLTRIIMPHDILYDDLYLYIIMPNIGEELFSIVTPRGGNFSEDESRFVFRQILDAVECLQFAHVCHRDLSLENLLIDRDGGVFVIDFGMALRIPHDNNIPPQRLNISPQGICGKFPYMLPEIYENRQFDSHEADLWSAAIILFTMFTGMNPWIKPDLRVRSFQLHSSGNLFTVENFEGVSESLLNLLQWMLALNPRKRITLEQVREHPWMTEVGSQNPIPFDND